MSRNDSADIGLAQLSISRESGGRRGPYSQRVRRHVLMHAGPRLYLFQSHGISMSDPGVSLFNLPSVRPEIFQNGRAKRARHFLTVVHPI